MMVSWDFLHPSAWKPIVTTGSYQALCNISMLPTPTLTSALKGCVILIIFIVQRRKFHSLCLTSLHPSGLSLRVGLILLYYDLMYIAYGSLGSAGVRGLLNKTAGSADPDLTYLVSRISAQPERKHKTSSFLMKIIPLPIYDIALSSETALSTAALEILG